MEPYAKENKPKSSKISFLFFNNLQTDTNNGRNIFIIYRNTEKEEKCIILASLCQSENIKFYNKQNSTTAVYMK